MKTLLYLISLVSVLTFVPTDSFACNTCGCGVANYHYGILPQSKNNFVGLRYRYRTYTSELEAGHLAPYSHEKFQSTELWARYYPAERLQIFAFVPYNVNERTEGEKTTYLQGLGDIVVSANYSIINTFDSASTGLSHTLLVGAGLKMPTGKFRALENGLTINQNFQLGTGSTDVLLNAIYTVRHRNLGVNAEFTYAYNTTNRNEYKFGNTTRSGLTAFFLPWSGISRAGKSQTAMVTLMPNVGVSLETFRDNRQYGDPFPDSGGWALLFNAGLEAYYGKVAVGATYTRPAKQELFNGLITAHERLSLHLTYLF